MIALEKSGQLKNALIAYNALLKRWPDSLAGQMGRGNTAYALHDLDTAEAAFRQATLDHPDAVAAFNNLAEVLAERGKYDDALAAAEHAVSLGGPLLPRPGDARGIHRKLRRQIRTESRDRVSAGITPPRGRQNPCGY